MASAVFTAINPAGGGVTYADGNTLTYDSGTGKFCVEFTPGVIDRDITSQYTGGFAGGGTKDFNYRGQDLMMKVTYVNSSEANCVAAWQTDIAIIAAVCTVVAGGTTYNACINQKGTKAEQVRATAFGTYRMDATVHVRATRP